MLALLSPSRVLTSGPSILEAEFQRNISTARTQFGSIENTDDEISFQSSALRRNVELQLFARVEQSGMLAYMSRSTLEAAARDISLSDGWWEFADAAMRAQRPPTVRAFSLLSQRYPHARTRLTNRPIQILSATLSIQWVRTALRVSHAAYCASSAANRGSSPETASICAPATTYGKKNLSEEIRIYCSDTLPTQLVPRSEHDHVQALHCGGDKVNFMQRQRQRQQRQRPEGTQIPVLYVGNDIADLPPIDYAGIGVLMGGTKKVVKRLKAEGARVEVFEVAKAMREGIEEGEGGGTVWQVRDFRALRAIFSG